eukprot:6094098-Heterocapsa_arctica.AAC.1
MQLARSAASGSLHGARCCRSCQLAGITVDRCGWLTMDPAPSVVNSDCWLPMVPAPSMVNADCWLSMVLAPSMVNADSTVSMA